MPNDKPASKRSIDLRKRAEKALQKRPPDNFDLAKLSAISCGLIITELITNSLKYAFPKNRKGEIRVEFGYLGDGQLEMRMSDDGVGMPMNFGFKHIDTLGVQIVKALAEHQLGGTVKLDSAEGTKFLIRFKERAHKGVI